LGALLLLLGSCSNIFEEPPSADSTPQAQEQGQGTLKLSINGSGARTLAPSKKDFVQYQINVYAASPSTAIGAEKTITGPFEEDANPFEGVTFNLDPGTWDIEVIAYVGDPPVASVKGVYPSLTLRAGEAKTAPISLNTPVETDAFGTFVYDIAIPPATEERLDSDSRNRDPYDTPPLSLPFPDDEFNTEETDANEYFSGAILRIIPDVDTSTGAKPIAKESNTGYVILDLLYGDESPGQGTPSPIDPKRYAKGKVELPAGRYKMYLSLVSDRAIGTTSSSLSGSGTNAATADYVGIFKEEVVYIYPNMTTSTPDSYTTFADKDMDAQVFFEGRTDITQPYSSSDRYAAKEVQVSRYYYPSHYYESSPTRLWTAPITNGEWNLYIPSQELAQGYDSALQGHLNINSDKVYFRFRMEDGGGRTLYSPWQEYLTREIQGQIDLDLWATVHTLTIDPNGGAVGVKIETGHGDTIVERGDLVYDIVRGVAFQQQAGTTSPYVEDVLIEVTPPNGKGIASFEAKTGSYPNISWRYAGSDENTYTDASSVSSAIPIHFLSSNKAVVYAIDNAQSYNDLDHYKDNSPSTNLPINTDLGTSAVTVTATYYDYRGSVKMNLTNMPTAADKLYVGVYDFTSNSLVDERLLGTPSTSTTVYSWDFDPLYKLPAYSSSGSYSDYDIYRYDISSPTRPYVNFSSVSGAYDNNGVYFQFSFVDTSGPTPVVVARTQPTRKYTAPELAGAVTLGISDTLGVSDDVTPQFAARADLPGRHLNIVYANDEQYYYFFSDGTTPYTLEYQDAYGNTGSGAGLANVDVSWYRSNGGPTPTPTPIGSVNAYPGQGVYGTPYGNYGQNLVSVVVSNGSLYDGGNYKLKVELPETYTVEATPLEVSNTTLRRGAVKYYKFTALADTLYYALFQDNVSVTAYLNSSAGTSLNGTGIYNPGVPANNSAFTVTAPTPVILAVQETSGSYNSALGNFTFRVATPTPLTLGTAASDLISGSIRHNTTQYYRATITAGTNYNMVFRDVAAAGSTTYADIRVTPAYSNGTSGTTEANGDNSTVYTVTSPAGQPGWVILAVTETTATPFTGLKPFGIKLYP
jgi:hypothetical protein